MKLFLWGVAGSVLFLMLGVHFGVSLDNNFPIALLLSVGGMDTGRSFYLDVLKGKK